MNCLQPPRLLLTLLPLWLVFQAFLAQAQQSGNVARLVVWEIKPNMEHDFEEGYKRHLAWHRQNGDKWTWHGWMIISGERDGHFVDGTFLHAWNDLDSPVSAAADGADNAVNVVPYADVRSVAVYEGVTGLVYLDQQQLTAPLLTFERFDIQPGRAAEFESLVESELHTPEWSKTRYALLRPANGVTEYLLLLPAAKPSDFAMQSGLTSHLLRALAPNAKGIIVNRFRTETGRYRPDLSYVPK
jgi:hypothetical protein